MTDPRLCPTCGALGQLETTSHRDPRPVRYCHPCRLAWFPDEHHRLVAVPDLPERKDLA